VSAAGPRRRVAVVVAVAVAAVSAGVGSAIADNTGVQSGPVAGVSVTRVVLRDANGAPIGVRATAILPRSSEITSQLVPAPVVPNTRAEVASTVSTARRGARGMTVTARGTTGVVAASAYRVARPLRSARLLGITRVVSHRTLAAVATQRAESAPR
jgi:hypothetical protein